MYVVHHHLLYKTGETFIESLLAYHFPVWMHVVYTHVLYKTGEALVEPKVVPPRWRHKITEPLKKNGFQI